MRNKVKIILSINNYCNYSCSYCITDIPYVALNNRRDMDYKLLNLLVYYVNKYLINYDISYSLLGGEPLLHQNFNSVIDILSHTKNIQRIRILTNSSLDFSKIITSKYPPEFSISIHYEQMIRHGYDYSIKILLSNIEYIINSLHGTCSLKLLIDDSFPPNIQDDIIEKYTQCIKTMNGIPEYYKMNILSTNHYINKKFTKSMFDNVYTRYGKAKAVFPYRIISIDTQFNYIYNCELIQSNNKNKNILLNNTWQDIVRHLDKPIICDYKECPCSVCLDVE